MRIKKIREDIPKDVKLVFLPTYAPPHLNRVEDINSFIQKQVMANRKCESIKKVQKAINRWVRSFNRIEIELVYNYIDNVRSYLANSFKMFVLISSWIKHDKNKCNFTGT